MSFPRLALGAAHPQADASLVALAMMFALRRRGVQIQHFHASACFAPLNVGPAVTGLESRHLDTWLMPVGVCRELFARSAALVDLSVIDGCLDSPRRGPTPKDPCCASLSQLAENLNCPIVAVVRAEPAETFHIPSLGQPVDGIVIDSVCTPRQFRTLADMLTGAWKAPVLGALESLTDVRNQLHALGSGSKPPITLCEPLAESFARYAQFTRIEKLADSRGFPEFEENLFGLRLKHGLVKVAVALDEAFNCYFPDTLDLLDQLGAEVVDFSPLHDDRLPEETDIVYFGCGHPESFAAALARNQCMQSALKSHVCMGKRVYAESGGLAYLCQQICFSDGSRCPMAGILPAEAHLSPSAEAPRPVEVYVERANWLAPVGQRLRGYLNTAWRIEPVGRLESCLGQGQSSFDLVSRYHAIGSRLHLNFAAQPRVFRSFLCPDAPSLRVSS